MPSSGAVRFVVFSSAIFLFLFLPVFLGVFLLTPRRARSIVMTIASYVFYGWWRPDFVFLMLFQSLVDWSIGLVIGREQSRGKSGRGDLMWVAP